VLSTTNKNISSDGLSCITWFKQAAFLFDVERKIYIDPWDVPENFPKADLIFITHAHFDHFDLKTIRQLSTGQTQIIAPHDVAKELSGFHNTLAVEPGMSRRPRGMIAMETVPAYNIDKPFHPKENNWVGYILTINDARYYHAGDTDKIPEMKHIRCDFAFLPVGGTYTMDAQEAADAAGDINPRIAVPMHYGFVVGKESDGVRFKNAARVTTEILKPNIPFQT